MMNKDNYNLNVTKTEMAWLKDAVDILLDNLNTVAHQVEYEEEHEDALQAIVVVEGLSAKLRQITE